MLVMIKPSGFYRRQNSFGRYVCLSIWFSSVVFCFYYLAMGAEISKVIALGVVSIIGGLCTILFTQEKNTPAVITQTILMYIALALSLSLPVIGSHTVICVMIIALNPIIYLNKSKTELMFANLTIALVFLSYYELQTINAGFILEQILDYFIKFIVIMFVFIQVYGLRHFLEREFNRIHNN